MTTLIIGLMVPMQGIVFGSVVVFLTRKEMSGLLQKSLLGFAAGVMVSASFWSLLLPAVEMASGSNSQFSILNSQKFCLLSSAF